MGSFSGFAFLYALGYEDAESYYQIQACVNIPVFLAQWRQMPCLEVGTFLTPHCAPPILQLVAVLEFLPLLVYTAGPYLRTQMC